jgi:hypothetical protein
MLKNDSPDKSSIDLPVSLEDNINNINSTKFVNENHQYFYRVNTPVDDSSSSITSYTDMVANEFLMKMDSERTRNLESDRLRQSSVDSSNVEQL